MIGIYSQSVYIYIYIYVWGQYACKFICLLYINIHSISNCLCCVIMKIGFRQNVLVKHVKEYDQHVEGHKIFWYHRPDDTTSERAIFISTSRGLTCIVMELSLVTFHFLISPKWWNSRFRVHRPEIDEDYFQKLGKSKARASAQKKRTKNPVDGNQKSGDQNQLRLVVETPLFTGF